MFTKKDPHQVACPPAGLSILVVERIRMRGLQQIVELGTIEVRQTNEMARRVPSGRAGEISVSALLAKVLLALNAWLLAEVLSHNHCGEMTHSLSLMARFAQHRTNVRGERRG